MYLRNGIKITLNQPIEADGITYPAPIHPHWFAVLGIAEVPDPTPPDPDWYTYVTNPDGSLVVSERPLSNVQNRRIRQFRNHASALFDQKYDLLDAVLVLSGQAPAPRTNAFNADVLALDNAFKAARAAVNAATTVAGVLAVVPVWPTL